MKAQTQPQWSALSFVSLIVNGLIKIQVTKKLQGIYEFSFENQRIVET